MRQRVALFFFFALALNAAALAPVEVQMLEREIGERILRVPEFRRIHEEATRRGLRVWLFGGTAAGLAQYVKRSLLYEMAAEKPPLAPFDFDFTQLFRSTQDVDLVLDGPDGEIDKFEEWLVREYPYFEGNKSDWEVRALRRQRNGKQPLRGDRDILEQHTDSHSTGLIEITAPPAGERRVLDLRDASPTPTFLRDVADGKLKYYFSETHDRTSRAREGKNPPFLSAVRYLTKLFQFDLEAREGDLRQIRQIVAAFRPNTVARGSYVDNWLERNGAKLVRQAANLERAVLLSNELGMTEKLRRLRGDGSREGTMAWWLSRVPLRAMPVGVHGGQTALELNIDVVAHETRDYFSYEAIAASHDGTPAVFVSRRNVSGEAAVYGEGFYTRLGREGARGTGLTLRFKVHPQAREGYDFKRVVLEGAQYIVFLNRAALTLIPESLSFLPVQFFEFVAEGKHVDASDLALLERLRRRLRSAVRHVSPAERLRIREIVFGESAQHDRFPALMREYERAFGPASVEDYIMFFHRLPPAKRLHLASQVMDAFDTAFTHDNGQTLIALLERTLGDSAADFARLLLVRDGTKPLANEVIITALKTLPLAATAIFRDKDHRRLVHIEGRERILEGRTDAELVEAVYLDVGGISDVAFARLVAAPTPPPEMRELCLRVFRNSQVGTAQFGVLPQAIEYLRRIDGYDPEFLTLYFTFPQWGSQRVRPEALKVKPEELDAFFAAYVAETGAMTASAIATSLQFLQAPTPNTSAAIEKAFSTLPMPYPGAGQAEWLAKEALRIGAVTESLCAMVAERLLRPYALNVPDTALLLANRCGNDASVVRALLRARGALHGQTSESATKMHQAFESRFAPGSVARDRAYEMLLADAQPHPWELLALWAVGAPSDSRHHALTVRAIAAHADPSLVGPNPHDKGCDEFGADFVRRTVHHGLTAQPLDNATLRSALLERVRLGRDSAALPAYVACGGKGDETALRAFLHYLQFPDNPHKYVPPEVAEAGMAMLQVPYDIRKKLRDELLRENAWADGTVRRAFLLVRAEDPDFLTFFTTMVQDCMRHSAPATRLQSLERLVAQAETLGLAAEPIAESLFTFLKQKVLVGSAARALGPLAMEEPRVAYRLANTVSVFAPPRAITGYWEAKKVVDEVWKKGKNFSRATRRFCARLFGGRRAPTNVNP